MTKEKMMTTPIIEDKEFSLLIQPYLKDFVSLSSAMIKMPPEEIPKPLIGRLLLESSRCEEMLDAFGASCNKYWLPVRMATATAKSFSRVIYNLFHLHHTLPSYTLLSIEGDFPQATKGVLNTLLRSITIGSVSFLKVANKMNLGGDLWPIESYGFRDSSHRGRLKANQQRKNVHDTRAIVVYLATSMLNLAEKSRWLDIYTKLKVHEYYTCIPDLVSEEQLRALANDFHSLQSLYDTYLSGSNITIKDNMLPVMRSNLTVVFHLLDTAVTLTHFYERHAKRNWTKQLCIPLSNPALLEIIIDYFIAYADKFIIATQEHCRDILKAYAISGQIEVPIPNYRGFHVRPSTLISKIVIHYGSKVEMIFGSTVYDASIPLELFRANEELNKHKRDTVVQYLMEHESIKKDAGSIVEDSQKRMILKMVFFDLLEKKKIMYYGNDFSFEDMVPYSDETLAEYVKRAITRYLAIGKLDIISDKAVVFKGDLRVLEDIKTLAENGYGEDKYGNNIVLPSQLSYLKR